MAFLPVRDPIASHRNVMATLSLVLEWHGGFPDIEWETALR
jgi:hypothetical protein